MSSLQFPTFEQFLDEKVAKFSRCTNVVLASLGICSQEEVKNRGQREKILERAYSVYVFNRPPQENFLYPRSIADEYGGPIDRLGTLDIGEDESMAIINSPRHDMEPHEVNDIDSPKGITPASVTGLNRKIKKRGPYGHYVIAVKGHVQVLHHTKDGAYLLDTAKDFNSRKRVDSLMYIGSEADDSFWEWKRESPEAQKSLKKI